jgi:hypothetical protein
MDDDYRLHYLRQADSHLAGLTESREWLKSVPKVYGSDRPLQGMGHTTTKRPRRNAQPEPDDAA